MGHAFKSETYHDPNDAMRRISYFIFHNNTSHPTSPITIVPYEINGEKLALDDPRRVEINLPFGLLAEFVGYRVCCDKISTAEKEMGRSRHQLGLNDQGCYVVHD